MLKPAPLASTIKSWNHFFPFLLMADIKITWNCWPVSAWFYAQHCFHMTGFFSQSFSISALFHLMSCIWLCLFWRFYNVLCHIKSRTTHIINNDLTTVSAGSGTALSRETSVLGHWEILWTYQKKKKKKIHDQHKWAFTRWTYIFLLFFISHDLSRHSFLVFTVYFQKKMNDITQNYSMQSRYVHL